MANAAYTSTWADFLNGDIDLVNDTIKAALIDTGTYTYNAAHDHYDDLSGVVGTDVTLSTKSILATGAFDSADPTWTGVTGTVGAVILYKDTGVSSTSPLICYIDQDASGTISESPSAENVTYTVPATGWFLISTS